MKIRKLQIVRPEIEVESARQIFGRLYMALIYPMLIKIKAVKINVTIDRYLYSGAPKGMAGTVYTQRIYIVGIPKVRWIDKKD